MAMFVDKLLQYNSNSMQANWSRHKTAPFQKLACHGTLLTTLQAPARPKEQPAVYESNRHESDSFQRNRHLGTANNNGLSSSTAPRQSYSMKGMEAAAFTDAGVV